ncbi:MAG: tyrosine-type recombinase/integrase [Desulfuromonadaceae bacterium]
MITKLATLITDFFMVHLAGELNVSQHTVHSYRDTFKMFLNFSATYLKRTIDRLSIEDLSAEVILPFLNDLETSRGNSVRTRNVRLAAIHSFFRYVLTREPALSALGHRVLAIPFKKNIHDPLGYLSEEELRTLLSEVDRSTTNGERNYVMLALLYDTGARVQELLDLTPTDFRFESPAYVKITGKGRKNRICPLLPQTAKLAAAYLSDQKRTNEDINPLFLNHCGQKLSRFGVRYLLKKYLAGAQQKLPTLGRSGISPHTMRHSKGMHLLQSGLPLIVIKDILGHADVKSTEIYVQIDLEMKRIALEKAGTPSSASKFVRHMTPDLLEWLEAL